jgi:hypothetical protein
MDDVAERVGQEGLETTATVRRVGLKRRILRLWKGDTDDGKR